jgi:hypothetical protein
VRRGARQVQLTVCPPQIEALVALAAYTVLGCLVPGRAAEAGRLTGPYKGLLSGFKGVVSRVISQLSRLSGYQVGY